MGSFEEDDAFRRFAEAYGRAWAPKGTAIATALLQAEKIRQPGTDTLRKAAKKKLLACESMKDGCSRKEAGTKAD